MASIYQDLPQIVRYEGKDDADEYGAARCPHCGAKGRYIYWFTCSDGTRRGAMAGCIQHFSEHRFATIQRTLTDKGAEYRDKGWNLPSWDEAQLDAIDDYADGKISEAEASELIRKAQWKRDNYRKTHKRF